jgi:endonuclease/exonuclease/phosphatase (EEP) superfamily protein YafD
LREPLLQQDAELEKPKTEPKKPRHRQWSGVIIGLLLGIGGLATGRLGQLYPHFDVFSEFGLQFLVISFAFICAAFFPRYKTLAGIVMTLGLLALYSAWPHIVSNQLQSRNIQLAKGETSLRVAHYNTFKNNFDYDGIANEIIRLDADVVGLIEMSELKKKIVLTKLRNAYPFQLDCSLTAYCDQAIVSKIPFDRYESLSLIHI